MSARAILSAIANGERWAVKVRPSVCSGMRVTETAGESGGERRAAKIVCDIKPDRIDPRRHAQWLDANKPEAGALARILTRNPAVDDVFDAQRRFSKQASFWQNWFRVCVRLGMWLALVATGGAFALTVLHVDPRYQVYLMGGVLALLFISWLMFVLAYVTNAQQRWITNRANAEALRRAYFEQIMKATEQSAPGELPALRLKLEYFVRFQLNAQIKYHNEKSQMGVLANLMALTRLLCLALAFFALLVCAMVGLTGASDQVHSFDFLNDAAGLVPASIEQFNIDQIAILFAVLVAALSTGLFVSLAIDNARVTAKRSAGMERTLKQVRDDYLQMARDAADEGDDQPTLRLVERTHDLMTAELGAFVELGGDEAVYNANPGHRVAPA